MIAADLYEQDFVAWTERQAHELHALSTSSWNGPRRQVPLGTMSPHWLRREVMGWTPLDGICCAKVAACWTASRGGVRVRG
jgi:hypothetical protein